LTYDSSTVLADWTTLYLDQSRMFKLPHFFTVMFTAIFQDLRKVVFTPEHFY